MKRVNLKEPIVFDLPYGDVILRVKIDKDGITFWKRAAQGNLDEPRRLDKMIKVSWVKIGEAGTCYVGSRQGHEERGPANPRVGLRYLTHKAK